MRDLNELRRRRGKLVNDMRALDGKAESERRVLTAEETEQWDKMDDDAEELRAEIAREEKLLKLEADLREIKQPTQPAGSSVTKKHTRNDSEESRAFEKFLTHGLGALNETEYRALQADDDAAGGFTFAPQQFIEDLIKAVDDLVFIRQLATVHPVTSSDSLGAPALDADPADADWTSEIAPVSEDSTMAFGKRELNPSPLAKFIKVSNKLIRISSSGIEAIVRDRLAYKFAVTEEKVFLTGHGANQPLGVFTASADGISTGRDVSTGNTTTSIGADGLIEAKYTLKAAYWSNARWIFHRDALKQIRKLKDGNGQYLWQPGLQAGQPDRILETPFLMSEFVPSTFTAGLYVGIIGDFRHYWIADSLAFRIQRLVELYAVTDQIGFIGRMELDGAPVLEEAFVRITLAP